MPHREKIAWLLLIAMTIAYVPYFTWVAIRPPAPEVLPNLPQLGLLALTAAAHAAIQGLGRLWFRIRSPQEAGAPADERDLAIERRSTTIAYYILIAGMCLVGVAMPFTAGGWKIVNAALLAIVLAETAHYGVALWSYRRGGA